MSRTIPLSTVAIRREPDIFLARQRERQIAQCLGFSIGDTSIRFDPETGLLGRFVIHAGRSCSKRRDDSPGLSPSPISNRASPCTP
jgi:hypothetical protein